MRLVTRLVGLFLGGLVIVVSVVVGGLLGIWVARLWDVGVIGAVVFAMHQRAIAKGGR